MFKLLCSTLSNFIYFIFTQDKMEDINSEMNKLKIQQTKESAEIETSEKIDPFCEKTINRLLQEVDFPKPSHSNGYFLLHDINLPAPKVGLSVALGQLLMHTRLNSSIILFSTQAFTYKSLINVEMEI